MVGRQVDCSVLVTAFCDDIVLLQHLEVVSDRLVIEIQLLREPVGITGPFVDRTQNPCAIWATLGTGEYVP